MKAAESPKIYRSISGAKVQKIGEFANILGRKIEMNRRKIAHEIA